MINPTLRKARPKTASPAQRNDEDGEGATVENPATTKKFEAYKD